MKICSKCRVEEATLSNEIPGFWQGGPHDPFPVEPAWREFVRSVGGKVVEDIVPEPRNFQNADFLFPDQAVVAELKEIETEFTASSAFNKEFDRLMTKLVAENPSWRPVLFGGNSETPAWFNGEFVRIFRPALSRIIKKANRQIKETKEKFGITSHTGVLILVNDGFTSINPFIVRALASDILAHSYSSVSAFVYQTVNRYVSIEGDDEPKILWAPSYHSDAPDELVNFIDKLGGQWFDYIEAKAGPFTSRTQLDAATGPLNAQVIEHPNLPKLKK